jgi:uncharacterized damage-inducible protein DinB
MPSPSRRLEALPGYAPAIGHVVGMLSFARHMTLAAVEGLNVTELDHLHDELSNSIGALLAHLAVVERAYQRLVFDERRATPEEMASWEPAMTLGAEGRRRLRGKPLEEYLKELDDVRRLTLAGLAARDDGWLERSLAAAPAMNAHFAWFHVVQHEVNHRGQIRWLRARLRPAAAT